MHGFRQAVYELIEGERVIAVFDLNIKGMTTNDAISRIVVGTIEAVLDGTASKLCENYP